GKDIICTDSLPADIVKDFEECQVKKEIMDMANKNAILNPCPPFYRGEEVSADVIDSDYFVGYQFKKYLLEIQQAIMIYCLSNER
ncbi:MAG: peptide transporter, partial [Acetatifactor sp.]|nr:peptide transporter [Acetatifactor sp.]